MIIIARIRKRIPKTARLKESVTHESCGCNAEYFERYIKGTPLSIVSEYEKIVLVEDSRGEQFTVSKSDFETV